jgi:hypothetical protein
MKTYSNKTISLSMTAIFARTLAVTAIIALSLWFLGCAATLPPSDRQVSMVGQSSGDLFKKAVRGLLAGGYEIKSQDQSIGLIQAFRPMTGTFSRPGYGHNVTITIENGAFTVKAFPMEGVVGGETPTQIRDEVIKLIGE